MRIGIDARCLEWERGGVARILVNLLRLWPQISDRHQYMLYFESRVPEDEFLRHPLFEHRIINGPWFLKKRRSLAMQLFMPLEMRPHNLDLFFAPVYYGPLLSPCPKTVVGAWDISYTSHQEHFKRRESMQMSFFSRHSCRRAVGILTCSPFDARQIQRYYGIPSERICVLRLAADAKFTPTVDLQRLEVLRRKYRLPPRYILSMGVILNRRSVDVIIDSFKNVYRDYADIGLVVVGRNSTVPFVDIEGKMKPLIEEGRGVYLPRVTEDELIDFYRGAWYYICTSTVDGEALMLKEAMKCGTPIITSPLLEETVGGAAVIVLDPTSRDETGGVFCRIILDYELRERLASGGLQWVQSLSWESVARESLRFIESR